MVEAPPVTEAALAQLAHDSASNLLSALPASSVSVARSAAGPPPHLAAVAEVQGQGSTDGTPGPGGPGDHAAVEPVEPGACRLCLLGCARVAARSTTALAPALGVGYLSALILPELCSARFVFGS